MSVVILLPLLLLIQAIGFGIGIVIIVGAVKMMRLKSHGLATVAGVLALLPCGPAWLLGLPMGIWSLVVLNRQNVKAAFHAQATRQPAQRSSGAGAGVRTRRHWWFGTALVLISLVVLASWFGPAMLARWNHKGLLEIETDGAIRGAQVLVTRGVEQAALIDVATHPRAYLEPGIYQLLLVAGSKSGAARTTPGNIDLSQSTVNVSAGSRHVVRVFIRSDVARPVDAHASPALGEALSSGWVLGPEEPVLTDVFAQMVLKLQPAQIEEVNKILKAAYQEYPALEAQYTERQTDDAGHLIFRINPFPGPIEKLENRLWSQLDAILDPQQQSLARLNLKLDPPELRVGVTMSDLVRPGFFGWSKEGASIELWRVGAWYYWKVQTRQHEYSARAPQLPEEYRRFWKEPSVATPPAKQPNE